MLKDIIKKQTPEVIEVEAPAKKNHYQEKKLKKWSIKKQTLPYTLKKKSPKLSSGQVTPPSGFSRIIPKGFSDRTKKALKALGWKEGDDSPKGGATGKKKIKQTIYKYDKNI